VPSLTASSRTLSRHPRLHGAFRVAFWVFAGSIAFSVAGMILLMVAPSTLAFFGPYLQALVVAPTWTYMALMPVLPLLMYAPVLGGRRLAFFFAWGCLIGLSGELLGTTTGMPFGEYAYTQWLGAKIGGHVPYFIPPSWFAMSILSLDLARRTTSRRTSRIVLATVFMVLWDVSLDPAMNGAGAMFGDGAVVGGIDRFWSYPPADAFKFYYGMPLSNWLGWFAVALVIEAGYELIGGGLAESSRHAPVVYFLNCLFPLLLCLMYGLFVPFLVGAAVTAVPLGAARWMPRHLERSVHA
jgi:putative membrane protein